MKEYKIKCDCGCENIINVVHNDVPWDTVDISIESDYKKSLWTRIRAAFLYIFKKENLLFKDNIIVKIEDLEKILFTINQDNKEYIKKMQMRVKND
jgi:hypothetical protein